MRRPSYVALPRAGHPPGNRRVAPTRPPPRVARIPANLVPAALVPAVAGLGYLLHRRGLKAATVRPGSSREASGSCPDRRNRGHALHTDHMLPRVSVLEVANRVEDFDQRVRPIDHWRGLA